MGYNGFKWAQITDPILGILVNTVWKFHDFSVIQILSEINFEECRSSKIAIFAILGALNLVNLVNFSL